MVRSDRKKGFARSTLTREIKPFMTFQSRSDDSAQKAPLFTMPATYMFKSPRTYNVCGQKGDCPTLWRLSMYI